MKIVATFLQAHVDAVFVSYILLFILGAAVWLRNEGRAREIEIGLSTLSMILMPLVYFLMFSLQVALSMLLLQGLSCSSCWEASPCGL